MSVSDPRSGGSRHVPSPFQQAATRQITSSVDSRTICIQIPKRLAHHASFVELPCVKVVIFIQSNRYM